MYYILFETLDLQDNRLCIMCPLKCTVGLPGIDPRNAKCNAQNNLPQVTHVLHFTFAKQTFKEEPPPTKYFSHVAITHFRYT